MNNGRAIGIKNGRAIINEQQVKEIRKRYKKENISYKNLGKEYNLSETQTTKIVKRESWKHVK